MRNPEESLRALVTPSPLTLGQIALLDLVKSPLLEGKWEDLTKTVYSLWLLSMPLAQAKEAMHRPADAILWAEGLGVETYNRLLTDALLGIDAFYRMLPRPEDGSKKNGLETATSPNSSNTPAESTDGAGTTS